MEAKQHINQWINKEIKEEFKKIHGDKNENTMVFGI